MRHWVLLLAITATPLHAEIFKCVDTKGKTTFSQRPCGDTAEIVKVKTTQPIATPEKSVSDYSAELEAISARTDIRKLERRIDKLQTRKRSLHRKMDAELSALRKKKLLANNNLAGAAWEQSISSEMEAVSTSYTSKIQTTQDQIEDTKRELEALRSR